MKYLRILKKLKEKSDHHQHKIACIIIKNGKIISRGYNLLKTSPRSYHPWKFIHAETMAVLKCTQDLEGAEIYVYRETKGKVPAMSRPCPSCLSMLKKQGIKRMYYTIDNSFIEEKING